MRKAKNGTEQFFTGLFTVMYLVLTVIIILSALGIIHSGIFILVAGALLIVSYGAALLSKEEGETKKGS